VTKGDASIVRLEVCCIYCNQTRLNFYKFVIQIHALTKPSSHGCSERVLRYINGTINLGL